MGNCHGQFICKIEERFLMLESPEILIENKEELRLISATAVHMEWERIFLKIDVKIEFFPGAAETLRPSLQTVPRWEDSGV